MLCASESASVLLMNVSREREREKEIVREGSVRYGLKKKTDSERLQRQRHVTGVERLNRRRRKQGRREERDMKKLQETDRKTQRRRQG